MSDEFFGPELSPSMDGLRCDACGFQTLRGRQIPEFAQRVVMSSLIIVLRRMQEDRSCGTTRHVSPLVRGVMSRFWYKMADADARHYWGQRLVQVLYAHLDEEAKYLG